MTFLNYALRVGVVLTLVLAGRAFADDIQVLSWENLLPEGETQQIPVPGHGPGGDMFPGSDPFGNEMSDAPIPMQSLLGGVVEDYNGKVVKLPGFIVPLEYGDKGRVKEFLLVPYFGACIHYPPPPPNQIVYVVLDEPVELDSIWDPVWAIGELKAERRGSELGTAGYVMAGKELDEYD